MKLTKRLISLLLAGVLAVSGGAVALAEDVESAVSSQPAEPTEETPTEEMPGELPESEPEGAAPAKDEEAPAESYAAGAVDLAAASILVTGGHKTYLSGYAGSLFKPDQVMTRAEVAQMLYNLLAAKTPVTESAFSDVPISAWYAQAVNVLYQKGVLSGYGDGKFAPNAEITRVEFVAALTKCFTLSGGSADFTDVPETHWGYSFIAAATSQGWINGNGDGTFEPGRGIKRSEAAAVVNAALGRTGDGFAADSATQKFKDVPPTHWAYKHISEAAAPLDETNEPDTPATGDQTIAVGDTVKVSVSDGLNLRSEPNTSGKRITTLKNGTMLTVTSIPNESWLGVTTESGTAGYVYASYVKKYVQGKVSGVTLSSSAVSLHQYQSLRLDGAIESGDFADMEWTSSNHEIVTVGYSMQYGSSLKMGAILYGKKPGTATITFRAKDGSASASCTVTVTAAEGVRYAYASENSLTAGESFDLVAIAESSKTSVTFTITDGGSGSYTATSYSEETASSSHGLPTNKVRVFKKSVTFNSPGTYTVKAQANGSSDSCTFTVFVSDVSANTATTKSHRVSTEMLKCIARYEGMVREIADDALANGNPTVGYGNVITKNEAFYNTLTDSETWAMLVEKVNGKYYGVAVDNFCKSNNIKLAQQQFDALTSFVYNLGSGVLTSNYGYMRALLNATAPPQNASEASPVSGKLNLSKAKLRETPTPGGTVVTEVPYESSVSVIGYKIYDDTKQIWYQVKYGGKTGWMPAGYIKLSGTSIDFTYADPTVVANNMLQWCTAGNTVYGGLVYRRQAECKVFFFGDYYEAYHYNDSNGKKNTYGFIFPSVCAGYEVS